MTGYAEIPKVLRPRHYWIATAAITVGALMTGVAAWYGSRFAVVSLAGFQIALAVLLHFQRNMTWNAMEASAMFLDDRKIDLEYLDAIQGDYIQVLGRLYELDPTAAEVYQDRLREAVGKRFPQFLEERAKHAGMN